MADYYPLIVRAIAGLDANAPGGSRRSLYDRARAALIAQLRGVQPPLSESETTHERLSLEEAIRKVETEIKLKEPEIRFREQMSRQSRSSESEQENDPLAELGRLIGQTDPFGSTGRANPTPPREVPYDEPAEEYPSAVHPLHRYAARQPAYPAVSDDPEGDLPAGPPAWVRRASAKWRIVVLAKIAPRHLQSTLYRNKTLLPQLGLAPPERGRSIWFAIHQPILMIESNPSFICASAGN